MLQMVNHLSIKQKYRTNSGGADRPTQPPVPPLTVEVTIAIKYLNNFL